MDIEYKKYKDTHLVYNDGRAISFSNSGYARSRV